MNGEIDAFSINGSLDQRVPHNLNISFTGISADELLAMLPDLALSTGSACSSGKVGPSHVLKAMGFADTEGALRVSIGCETTNAEIAQFAAALSDLLARRATTKAA